MFKIIYHTPTYSTLSTVIHYTHSICLPQIVGSKAPWSLCLLYVIFCPLKLNLVMSFVLLLCYLPLPPGLVEFQDLTFSRGPLRSYPLRGGIKVTMRLQAYMEFGYIIDKSRSPFNHRLQGCRANVLQCLCIHRVFRHKFSSTFDLLRIVILFFFCKNLCWTHSIAFKIINIIVMWYPSLRAAP